MAVTLNPYLNFQDNARAAMEFYQSVFGGELTLSTFGEAGSADDPADTDKIMHSQLIADEGLTLMASDTPGHMTFEAPKGFSVSLSGEDDAELRKYWERLNEGGQQVVPLEVAPWGDAFGWCVDKFGISWMVNISGAAQA